MHDDVDDDIDVHVNVHVEVMMTIMIDANNGDCDEDDGYDKD